MRWCVVMSVAVGVLAGVAVGVCASLTLVDQGYEDLVVGISPSLDESQAQEIIAGVKAAMDDASHALFAATKHQLYFKKVKILVPNTWTSFPVDQEATNENFEESHIRVDKEHPVYKDQVYTKHVGKCRKPGLYIHLTKRYLTKTHQRWGARGKELVKAWAKLRWGVFEEGGYKDDEKYPLFYYTTKGNEPVLRPNRCNEEIKGRFIDRLINRPCIYSSSVLPGKNCRFKPDPQQTSTSSLMSFTNLDHIDEFCDDNDNDPTTLHDSEAPNRHNDLCDGLSVWEIMSAHQDFKNVRRLQDDYPVSPEVVVVKKPVATFALVLDYSVSMKGRKISVLANTVKRWLLHDVADGSFVTIIDFAKSASLVRGLTKISNSTRQELSSAINTELRYYTCIGCGLRRAVQEMKGRNNKVILLITDGKEYPPPNIASPNITTVMDEVVNSKARVVTIAYGNSAADKLETLAKNTGGKTFFVPDNDDGSTMDKALQGSLTYQPGNTLKNANVKIEEGTYSFPGRSYAKRYFEVDPTVGRNLEFRLSIHPNIEGEPYLISDSGKNFTKAQFFKDSNLWIIRLGDTVAESGNWSWIKPLSYKKAKISITITAQASDPLTLPITTQAGMNIGQDPLYATEQKVIVYGIVEQDENPVVGAKVMAYITTQNTIQKAYELELLDNGSNADQTANDGTYSRYFTQFSSLGRYSVEVQVTNGDSYINHGFITSRRRRRRSSDETEVPEYCCGSFMPFNRETATSTGKFKRFASAGSFRVEKKPDDGVDLFPPCKVRDVTVKVIGKSLELNWTAPGDDYDNGKVSGYEIWMSSNSSSLKYELKETTNTIRLLDIDSSSKMPELLKESGKKVSVHLPLKESLKANTLYFLVLRAEDHSRNKAPMSRPVSFVASGGVRVTNTLYPWILSLLLLTVMYCWC